MNHSHVSKKRAGILSMLLAALALGALVLGAGCAGYPFAPEQTGISPPADNTPAAEPVTDQPVTDQAVTKDSAKGFTEEVLYDLLVAEVAEQRNRIPVAASNYLAAAIASQDASIAKRATHIALFAGEQDQALQSARLWAELDPDAMAAKRAYGALLVRAGRIHEAIPIFRVLMNDPGSPPGKKLMSMAEFLSRGKDRTATLAAMEQLIAEYIGQHGDQEPQALFALAHFLLRIEEQDRAILLLQRVIATDSENPAPHLYYAQTLHDRGQTEKALEVLSRALTHSLPKNTDHQEIRIALAKLAIGVKRYKVAREQLERVVRADPGDTESRYTLMLLLLQTGHPDKARGHLRHLTARGNLTPEAYFNLGQLAEAQNDHKMALEAYGKVTYGDDYLDAQLRIAALLAARGDLQAARARLHGIQPESEEDAIRVYRMEGVLLTDAGDFEAAMSVYDAALEKYPEDNDFLYARAMLGERMGQLPVLERDLKELLAREPDHADALNALGYTLANKTDRHQEALALIQRAFRLKPDTYYILDSMGWALYRLGRHREAIGYLRRALAARQDAEIAAHLGEVLWVTDDKKGAREVWNTALEAAPEDKFLLEVMERFGE